MITREKFVESAKISDCHLFNDYIIVCYTEGIQNDLAEYLEHQKVTFFKGDMNNIGALVIPHYIRINHNCKPDAARIINAYLQYRHNLTKKDQINAIKDARNKLYTDLEKLDAYIYNKLKRPGSWYINDDGNVALIEHTHKDIFETVDTTYKFDGDYVMVYNMITSKRPLCNIYNDGDIELTNAGIELGNSILGIE